MNEVKVQSEPQHRLLRLACYLTMFGIGLWKVLPLLGLFFFSSLLLGGLLAFLRLRRESSRLESLQSDRSRWDAPLVAKMPEPL